MKEHRPLNDPQGIVGVFYTIPVWIIFDVIGCTSFFRFVDKATQVQPTRTWYFLLCPLYPKFIRYCKRLSTRISLILLNIKEMADVFLARSAFADVRFFSVRCDVVQKSPCRDTVVSRHIRT